MSRTTCTSTSAACGASSPRPTRPVKPATSSRPRRAWAIASARHRDPRSLAGPDARPRAGGSRSAAAGGPVRLLPAIGHVKDDDVTAADERLTDTASILVVQEAAPPVRRDELGDEDDGDPGRGPPLGH